jgi:hypothetical protein
MAQPTRFRAPHALAATALALLVGGAAATAQDVNVTLNGNAISLSPPPVTRAGRVFVPLRGVFEKLGASVVYANGDINAQGNGHQISLHIGSNNATVDGNAQQLDVAPFIDVQADPNSVHVMLDGLDVTNQSSRTANGIVFSPSSDLQSTRHTVRVVGSDVDHRPFDRSWQFTSGAVAEQPANRSDLAFRAVRPGNESSVPSRRPTIEAQFGDVQADPNTIRVSLDGLDVTNQSTRTPKGIVYSPPSDLQSTRHTVRVVGSDLNNRPFDRSWQFTSGTAAAAANFIENLRPADQSSITNQIVVAGKTAPNARVLVQLGVLGGNQDATAQAIGQLFGINTARAGQAVRVETNADANGNFETQVNMEAQSGQHVALIVDSTEPRTQEAAHVRRTLTVR